jgi:hypothetical protein
VTAGSSQAATPIAGDPYVGGLLGAEDYREAASARLVVSGDGRHLVPGRRTWVLAFSACRRDISEGSGGAKLRVSARVPIAQDGSFRLVERRGDRTVRARGRFTTPWSARVVIRARARPADPRNPRRPGFCSAGPSVITLTHVGDVAFRDCRAHPAQTIAEDAAGRIFVHYRARGVYVQPFFYGCLYSSDRRVFLGNPDEELYGGPEYLRIGGTYAAYALNTCRYEPCYDIHVVDLRTGVKIRKACCGFAIFDLVVDANGVLAFIQDPPGDAPPEVRAIDGDSTRLLGSGPGIDRQSLTLDGNVLSWTKDGVVQTAPLDPDG